MWLVGSSAESSDRVKGYENSQLTIHYFHRFCSRKLDKRLNFDIEIADVEI